MSPFNKEIRLEKPFVIKEKVLKPLGQREQETHPENEALKFSNSIKNFKELTMTKAEADDPFEKSTLMKLMQTQAPKSKNNFLPVEIYDPLIDTEEPM